MKVEEDDTLWWRALLCFAVVLVYVVALAQCTNDCEKRGGHEVTNGYGFPTCIEKTP